MYAAFISWLSPWQGPATLSQKAKGQIDAGTDKRCRAALRDFQELSSLDYTGKLPLTV